MYCDVSGHLSKGDLPVPKVFWGGVRAWSDKEEVIVCCEEVLSSGRLSIMGEGYVQRKVLLPLWVAILCKISKTNDYRRALCTYQATHWLLEGFSFGVGISCE